MRLASARQPVGALPICWYRSRPRSRRKGVLRVPRSAHGEQQRGDDQEIPPLPTTSMRPTRASPKGLLSHVDPHLTLGQLIGRLVREGLDRHDPARPPRGRRTAPAKGAEQTSAPKTQAASACGAASAAKLEASADRAAPSAAKVSAQAPAETGDAAADRPDTSAAKPATDTTSASKTRRLGRQAAACAQPAAPPRTQTSAAKTGVTGRAIPAAVKREVWRRTGAAAATWTAPAGGAAAPNTCCRSITSCRMPAAAAPSRTISGCCAPPITATATSAPDSGAPARIGRRRFRSALLPKAWTGDQDRRETSSYTGTGLGRQAA